MQLLKHPNKWLSLILVIGFSLSMQAQSIVGQKVPSLVLKNQQGNNVSLADLQGKYVLVNFWASWCPESVIRLPAINKIKQDNSDSNPGFEVFNVALDEDVNAWLQTCRDNNLQGEYQCVSMGRYDSYCAMDFGISKLPTYFLISPDGTIVEQDAPFGQIESYLTTGNTSSEQANVSYKVSLGHFGSLHYHNAFSHLSHLGPIVADMLSETDYLVWIGPFTDYSSALYAEQQAKKMGYLEAQNTSFEDNSPTNNTFTTPNVEVAIAIKPTNEDRNRYPTKPTNEDSRYPIQNNAVPIAFTPPVPATQGSTENPTKTPAFVIAPSFEEKVNPSLTNLQENTNKPIPAAPWEEPNMTVSVPATPPAFGVSPELDEKKETPWGDKPIYTPIDNAPSETYVAIANNPRIQNRIDRLEKKKKRHDNKANKIDAKIRDIEQDAVMKSVYGKTKK